MAYNLNKIWEIDKKVKVFFSEKNEGSMRISLPVPQEIIKNRQALCQKINVNYHHLVSCCLDHGKKVAVVKDEDAGRIFDKTDSLITNSPNLFLTVTAADCLPVFFYDPKTLSVGLAHAGWKGLNLGILEKTVLAMQDNFNSSSTDILIFIGPSIGGCHYEVDEARAKYFAKYPSAISLLDGKYMLDLPKIAALKLVESGIRINNITTHPDCTYCHADKYFSFRRDTPLEIQAHCALIGIVK